MLYFRQVFINGLLELSLFDVNVSQIVMGVIMSGGYFNGVLVLGDCLRDQFFIRVGARQIVIRPSFAWRFTGGVVPKGDFILPDFVPLISHNAQGNNQGEQSPYL